MKMKFILTFTLLALLCSSCVNEISKAPTVSAIHPSVMPFPATSTPQKTAAPARSPIRTATVILPTKVIEISTISMTPEKGILTRETEWIASLSGIIEGGAWRWWVKRGQGELITHIASADGKTEWSIKIPSEYIRATESENGYYRPVYKLTEEPYLYLTHTYCCGWDVQGRKAGEAGLNLARINLVTGEVSWPVKGLGQHFFFFSPQSVYFADVEGVPVGDLSSSRFPRLRFIRFVDGERKEITLPKEYNSMGQLFWSPYHPQALFITDVSDYDSIPWQLPLILVDIDQQRYQTIIPDLFTALSLDLYSDLPPFGLEWVSEDWVKVRLDGEKPNQGEWEIDLKSGAVTRIQ